MRIDVRVTTADGAEDRILVPVGEKQSVRNPTGVRPSSPFPFPLSPCETLRRGIVQFIGFFLV